MLILLLLNLYLLNLAPANPFLSINSMHTLKSIQGICIILFTPICLYCQVSTHHFQGIDLNQNWTTLTKQHIGGASYYTNISLENNLPGVSVPLHADYYTENASGVFQDLSLTSITLLFDYNGPTDLTKRAPVILLAQKVYNSDSDYAHNISGDFQKALTMIENQYGTATSKSWESYGSIATWELSNAHILLNNSVEVGLQILYKKL